MVSAVKAVFGLGGCGVVAWQGHIALNQQPRNGVDGKALVLQAVDLVALIGQTVNLKRRGRSYTGLCPFHQEKTPSFHVRPELGFFHCFGCKASGNAIDFVMKRDRIEFVEALRQLAEQHNIELPKLGTASKQAQSERQQLLDANAAAVMFFENQLADPRLGASAMQYLVGRGFTPDTLKRFHAGLAVDAWDALLTGPVGRKFGADVLHRAGLVKARESGSGHYDTFRNRIIFPIRDEQGRTIAFGGRILPGDPNPAKYLNSPETPLFSKSRCAFGLDLARQAIVESRTVAIVEGYTDVMMAHQYGVSNVVSVLGTALTEQHVTILRRFADRIVLLFDGDSAGDLAVNRAVELFLSQPVEIAIATLPDGLDPDEFVMNRGASGFRELLDTAKDALTYQWERLQRRLGEDAPLTARQKAVSEYLDLLGSARNAGPIDQIRWGMALKQVGRLTGLSDTELHARFGQLHRPNRHREPPAMGRTPPPTDEEPTSVGIVEKTIGRDVVAARWLLGSILCEPDRWNVVQTQIGVDDFPEGLHRELAQRVWDQHAYEGAAPFSELLGDLSEPLKQLAIDVVEEVERLSDLEKTVSAGITHFQESRQRAELKNHQTVLRRNKESAIDESALFAAFVKKTGPADARRLPPSMRRS